MDATSTLPVGFLMEQEVSRDLPLHRVLYSWTTQEQHDQLRAGGDLLMRTERPGVGGGVIRQVLAGLAASGDALAQALTAPEFQKARYAWPNPWATLRGWPRESYGNKLIQIELRADAWVMVLHRDEVRVVDEDGVEVAREEALASPERIGAIFHTHLGEDTACYGSFFYGGAGSFREYFLPNAAMIAGWSLDTREMRDRLVADLEQLRTYRAHQQIFADEPYRSFETSAACSWEVDYQLSPAPSLDAYLRALALASPLYVPSVANLDALIAALEGALFEPDPFVRDNF